jgi:molybdopterin-synthase adenylyltransferase
MSHGADDPRYARQVAFAPIGKLGQEKLLAARVAVVGAGALGAVALEQLARSGVGRIRVIDRDVVEDSNLGRQSLYTDADARARIPKAVATARHIASVNPHVTIEPSVAALHCGNVAALLADVDLVIDGTDNLDTRYLINDYAVQRGVPWIYGGCVGSRGLTAVVVPGTTRCLRCVYPDPPPPGTLDTCETAGVIAPIANLIASIEVVEALKLLTGALDRVRRTWICVDLWPFRMIEVGGKESGPRPDCPACGRRDFPFLQGQRGATVASLCGRDAVHVVPEHGASIDLDVLAERLSRIGRVKRHEFVLVVSIADQSLTIFDDGRALVKGTSDPGIARALYDRYVGS